MEYTSEIRLCKGSYNDIACIIHILRALFLFSEMYELRS